MFYKIVFLLSFLSMNAFAGNIDYRYEDSSGVFPETINTFSKNLKGQLETILKEEYKCTKLLITHAITYDGFFSADFYVDIMAKCDGDLGALRILGYSEGKSDDYTKVDISFFNKELDETTRSIQVLHESE